MGTQTLFIAAGHGGRDAGNTDTGHTERDELIRFVGGMRRWYRALRVRHGLGGVVFLDDALDLQGELVALHPWRLNAQDGDLAVDFHLDYRRTDPDGGALVLYDEAPYARTWAERFLAHWCAATGVASNGVHRSSEVAQRWRGWPDYGFTAQPWPGVIVELGCLTHAPDLAVVRDPFCQALAGQLLLETTWDLGFGSRDVGMGRNANPAALPNPES